MMQGIAESTRSINRQHYSSSIKLTGKILLVAMLAVFMTQGDICAAKST
jgi:hypothetical protein